MTTIATTIEAATFPEVASWFRSLRVARRSPLTIQTYDQTIRQLYRFLAENGMPIDVENIRREHLESYAESLAARVTKAGAPISDATMGLQHRNIRAFFNWLSERDYITRNPVAKMKTPIQTIREVDFPNDEELVALFKTCEGRTFTKVRDTAILHMFIATGLRLAELSGLTLADLDLDAQKTKTVGKGKRERTVQWSDDCATALDRYLVKRARHPTAGDPMLWLGVKGPLTSRGVAQMVKRRGAQARITRFNFHAHTLRHLFAAAWLANGGPEGELLELGGWTTAAMIHQRYGKATRGARAHAKYPQFAPRVPRR